MKRFLTFSLLCLFFSGFVTPVLSQTITYGYTNTGSSDSGHAEGDVSAYANTKLKFTKKGMIAIAILNEDKSFTNNALFQGLSGTALANWGYGGSIFNATAVFSTAYEFKIVGAIYSTASNFTDNYCNSIGWGSQFYRDYNRYYGTVVLTNTMGPDYGQISIFSPQSSTNSAKNITGQNFVGICAFAILYNIVESTLDVTDRAGDYVGTVTLTINTI